MLTKMTLDQIARRPLIARPVIAGDGRVDEASLRIECVSDLADLDRYARDWNELAALSADRMPTNSYPFVRSYLEHELDPAARWICLFAFDRVRLVGVLPLVVSLKSFPLLSRACVHPPTNGHILSVTVLSAASYEETVVGGFLRELRQLEPHLFKLSFDRTHEAASIFNATSAVSKSCWVAWRPNGSGSYLPIMGKFSDYYAGIDSKLRHNLARREKKLAAVGDVSMHFLSNCHVTDEAFEEFLVVEASGWKGVRGSAILSSPKRADFYRSLMKRLREAGWLELHLLKVNGKAIAADFGVKMGPALVLWKVGYDECFAPYGPGILLFKKIVEHAFTSGDIEEVNLVTNVPMHKDWHLQRRTYFDLFLYPRRPIPYLLGLLPRRTIETLRTMPVLQLAVQRSKKLWMGLP